MHEECIYCAGCGRVFFLMHAYCILATLHEGHLKTNKRKSFNITDVLSWGTQLEKNLKVQWRRSQPVLPKFFFSFSESLNAGQLRPSSTQGSYWHRVLVGVCFSQVFIHAVNKYLSSHDKRLEQEIFSFLILLKLEQLNTQRKWNIKKQ